jgi:hypothetical protein
MMDKEEDLILTGEQAKFLHNLILKKVFEEVDD